MGYHRPIHTYNIGKQQEHADRVKFEEGRVSDLIQIDGLGDSFKLSLDEI